MMYDVSVSTQLPTSLSHQTVFFCHMEIPGTQFSLNKRTMYQADSELARATRRVQSGGAAPHIALSLLLLGCL